MAQLNLFTVIYLFCSLSQVTSEEYYITANSTEDLCIPPCLTLTQFTTDLSHIFNPSVTLIFTPGRHYLNVSLVVSNLSHFSMISQAQYSTAQIRCTSFSQIILGHSQNIHITNVEFIGCGGNQIINVDKFVVNKTTFTGQENSAIALELFETTAQIINSTFKQGTIIATHSNVNVCQCNFESNESHNYNVSVHRGTVLFADQQSNISIIASTFTSNSVRHAVIYSYGCSVTITTSRFFENNINYNDGALLTLFSSSITIEQSNFEDNIGSVLFSDSSIVKISTSEFLNNTMRYGQVLSLFSSNTTIEQSTFQNNIGSVLFHYGSTVRIQMSNFYRVTLISYGSNTTVQQSVFENNVINNSDPNTLNSVFTSQESNVMIRECTFSNNFGIILTFTDNRNSTIDKSEFRHNTGSVVLSSNSTVTIIASVFDNNTEAAYFLLEQGIVLGSSGDSIVICDSSFTNNNSPDIVAFGSIIRYTKSLLMINNSVENGFAIIHLDNSEFIGHHSGNATISNNLRSLVAFTSNITLKGNVKYSNNQQSITTTDLQEGGAITLIQSNAYLDGTCKFECNHAENGGAILSIDSKLYVNGNVSVAHNVANRNGGGIYLTESDLECLNKSTLNLFNNTAKHKGGGLHAISSFIKDISVLQATQVDTATLKFTNNIAERGGGLSLEANANFT